MGTEPLLNIEPNELRFPFELKKQISCSLQLSNTTDNCVIFKVKTTNPKKYCVRPNTGVIPPRSVCDVIVTMQAQKEAPPDMQCKDKFLLQSVVAKESVVARDITTEMFVKEEGRPVHEFKLRVAYVLPPQPPSPVREGSEEGSSPRASISDNGNSNDHISRSNTEHRDNNITEGSSLILKLTEEKNSAIHQNNKLKQELELLKRETGRSNRGGGFSFMSVLVVALIGVLMGYFLKRS